jgi:hypothetical protein
MEVKSRLKLLASGGSVLVDQMTHNPKFYCSNPEAVFLVVCDPSMNEL